MRRRLMLISITNKVPVCIIAVISSVCRMLLVAVVMGMSHIRIQYALPHVCLSVYHIQNGSSQENTIVKTWNISSLDSGSQIFERNKIL